MLRKVFQNFSGGGFRLSFWYFILQKLDYFVLVPVYVYIRHVFVISHVAVLVAFLRV